METAITIREPMILCVDGNKVEISTETESILGIISKNMAIEVGCFLEIRDNYNFYIFQKAGISDRFDFQEFILGYKDDHSGNFPHCKTREDVIKLVKAIVDYNNRHVGDRFDCPLANSIELKKRLHIKFNFKL